MRNMTVSEYLQIREGLEEIKAKISPEVEDVVDELMRQFNDIVLGIEIMKEEA